MPTACICCAGSAGSAPIFRSLCCAIPTMPPRGKEATRLGAEEILVRPFDGQQLESVIRRHLGPGEIDRGNGSADIVSENVEQLGEDAFFVSASPTMQKLRAQAALLAQTDVPVLILGEAGTGKYTVASLIHKLSVRSGFKLQFRVNCAEMPDGSARSRTVRGRFRFLRARLAGPVWESSLSGEKGTIFLDEIAAMPAELQSRLLQVCKRGTPQARQRRCRPRRCEDPGGEQRQPRARFGREAASRRLVLSPERLHRACASVAPA